MYLTHFGFKELPFTLTPNLHFYCNLEPYSQAFNLVMLSLQNGEGFLKITGEVGTGKTLLCRKILDNLEPHFVSAYLPNPNLDGFNLQKAIAHELEVQLPDNLDQHTLQTLLVEKIFDLNRNGKKIVVIIDEAQILSDEALESLRLLSNLETETTKLLYIILVGQTELDQRLQQKKLRQLNQRIAFSAALPTLSYQEMSNYLSYRLITAGYKNQLQNLFSMRTLKLLHKASKGTPRLINILCHKALLLAYGYNKNQVNTKIMRIAVQDTLQNSQKNSWLSHLYTFGILAITVCIGLGVGYYIFRMKLL